MQRCCFTRLRRNVPFRGARLIFWMPEQGPPRWPSGLLRVRRGYATGWVDLSFPEAQLRARLRGKWRNALVAAEREVLQVTSVPWNSRDASWLMAQEEAQRREKQYRALPLDFLEYYLAAGGEIMTLIARRQGQSLAGVLLLRHGGSATYHLGYTNQEGRRRRAHHLLLWQAMLALKGQGVRWLDMGGLFEPASSGIARFKRGLGGEEVQLPGTFV